MLLCRCWCDVGVVLIVFLCVRCLAGFAVVVVSPFVCVFVSFACVGVCVGAGVVCSVLTLFGRVLLLLLFMLLLCCAVFGLVLFRVCF